MLGLPAEQLAGAGVGGRVVGGDEAGEEAEVVLGVVGVDAARRQLEAALDELETLAPASR